MINYNSEDLQDHDAIAAVVKDDSGNVLMQEHVKFDFWTIPIGKAKTGQTPEKGMIEEIAEECGVEVTEYKKLGVEKLMYERNGRDVHIDSHLYEVLAYTGEVINGEPEKHIQQVFMSIDDILALPHLSDATIFYLKILGYKRTAQLR